MDSNNALVILPNSSDVSDLVRDAGTKSINILGQFFLDGEQIELNEAGYRVLLAKP